MSTAVETKQTGLTGEIVAARFLESLGWHIIDRNWRSRYGEIDLVALEPTPRGAVCVIVEVKTRSGIGFGHPLEAITHAKLQRLRRLAVLWLQEHKPRVLATRIDAVSVILDATPRVHHVRNLV